jgi:hypothetical protein
MNLDKTKRHEKIRRRVQRSRGRSLHNEASVTWNRSGSAALLGCSISPSFIKSRFHFGKLAVWLLAGNLLDPVGNGLLAERTASVLEVLELCNVEGGHHLFSVSERGRNTTAKELTSWSSWIRL